MNSPPKEYVSVLCQFLSFMDGITYSRHDFNMAISQARLLEITDHDVARYLTFKAFGTPAPAADAYPTFGRTNGLLYQKKALSWFMPRKNLKWDDVEQCGNPTKSIAVQNVLDFVAKHEVGGTGRPSNARHAVEWDEYYVNVLMAARDRFLSQHKEQS